MIEKSINTLKGIGDKNSKLFSGLGISTIGDMLKFYPRIYSDRTVKNVNSRWKVLTRHGKAGIILNVVARNDSGDP